MPNDQPQAAESTPSVEDRMAAFFGGPAAKPAPVQTPTAPVTEQAQPDQQVEEPAIDEPPEEYSEGAEQEPELAEVEYNGKVYKVDPELREAVMLKADYTRKTQEISAAARALEIEKAAFQSNQIFNQQVGQLSAELSRLNSLKEQAERIDRNSLTTDQRLDLDYELRKIERQIGDLSGYIGAAKEQHFGRFNQMVVGAVLESEKFMAQKVPGWNQATGNALHQYGRQLGIPSEKLASGWFSDPVATHVMWKAQQWDRLQASKPGVANKSASAPPVSKPGSPAANQSMRQSEYKQARSNLKKSGSVDDFAAALLASQKRR